MIKGFVRRYAFFICVLAAALIVLLINRSMGCAVFNTAASSFIQMLSVLPPVMMLICLMDVWMSRETVMKYMGNDSGVLGVTLAIVLGSLAAGPMYASFPFTVVLLRKGVKFSNVIIFMDAWCVTKISTFIFEVTSLGYKFSVTRLLVNVPGIIIMGYLVEWLTPKEEINRTYAGSQKTD